MIRFFRITLIAAILGITIFSRFLNLNWDRGWGFHPDENNLWGASRRVELFSKLDPQFYAYGGFPIYFYSLLSNKVEARAVSAGAQVLIVILLFVIGRKIAGWNAGFFAAVMGTFSAGLVQAGHFLTVESLLGLFSMMIILLKTLADRASSSVMSANFWLIMEAVVLGLGVGTKVSFAVFGLIFFGRTRIFALQKSAGTPEPRSRALARHARRACEQASVLLGLFIIVVLVFLLTNPFIFSKWGDVKSTLEYEAKVATGNLPVFYTRQFMGTVPGWFQAIHVFPYITGWLFLPMVLIGAFVVCFKDSPWRPPLLPTRLLRELFVHGSWSAFRRVNTPRRVLIISMLAALLSFLPFWAKWTRYAVQVLPILILIAGVGAGWVWEKGKAGKAIVIAAMISFLPQFFSTLNVYANEDTRIAAAKWAEVNISKDAKIFTEAMDLGILPFNPTFGQNIKLFNFYELDEVRAEEKQRKLDSLIQESDYFILLSRRVYKNSLDRPDKFPRAAVFYRRLFDGTSGYKKIYESITPSTFYLLPSSLSSREETFEVFDNPHLMIFQKKP